MTSAGLNDSLTVGILLLLVFGAVSFYLYSRMSQAERRMGLLENLLMDLKISTEAALSGPEMLGPDSVEPTSSPAPLGMDDVDTVDEEEYAALAATVTAAVSTTSAPSKSTEVPEALRTIDANYESMTVKELASLVKERGITGAGQRKRELIDALKRQGQAPPTAVQPLEIAEDELEGATVEDGAEVSS